MRHIPDTPQALKRLKIAYADAVGKRKDRFEFDGETILLEYASPLINHLENVLNAKTP